MDFTVITTQGQYFILILIFFSALGYWIGWLFKELNFLRIVVLIFAVPISLSLLIEINYVYSATIPYLVFAWFGYYGLNKSYQNIKQIYEVFR